MLVIEAGDSGRVERTLVELADWLIEHARARSGGLIVPTRREDGGAQPLRIWTPFGKLDGPTFASEQGHLLVATGERALSTGRSFARHLARDAAVLSLESATGGPAHASVVARGLSLSRLLASVLEFDAARDGALPLAVALGRSLAEIETVSVRVLYEDDAVRIRVEARLRHLARHDPIDHEETPAPTGSDG